MNDRHVRSLIREATRHGLTLWVEDGELHCKARKGGIPAALRATLQLHKRDLIGELSQPIFIKHHSATNVVRYPPFWSDFWQETQANLSLSNTTHFAIRLRGDISLERIDSALQRLTRRYDLLRSRVRLVDGALCLVLEQHEAAPVEIVDTSANPHLPLDTVIAQAIYTPFENGELYRARIIKISDSEYVIAVVIHHFVADAISCKILTGQLLASLRNKEGLEITSAERPLQYSDYLSSMNEWLAGAGLEHRMAWWKEKMQAAPAVRLPLTAEPCRTTADGLDAIVIHVNEALRANVARAASDSRVPLAVVCLAANFAALFRTLHSSDLVVHLIHSGRDDPKLMGLVGMTVNCFPVRVSVLPRMSYADLLTRVNDTYLLARDYQVPWGLLMRSLEEIGAGTVAPLFNFLPARQAAMNGGGSLPQAGSIEVDYIPVKRPPDTASVGWKSHELTIVDLGKEMLVCVKYMPAKYLKATVVQFTNAYLFCLQMIAREPARSLGA